MANEILEREDPQEATPAPEAVESAETEIQPEVPEETKGEQEPEPSAPVEEPEYEVEGQRYKASQLKEALDAAKNKSEWQKSNTLKAQEIAAKRKELEQAEAIYNLVKSDPTKLQKLLAPEPERDFDGELKSHYQKRPEVYGEDYIKWEFERDRLVAEQASEKAFKHAQAQESMRAAKEHNDGIVNRSYDKYKGKVSDDEFQAMASWLSQNIQPKDGRYPETSFDVAYRFLYGERDVETAKLTAAKAVGDSIRKAKPASGEKGTLPKPEHKTPSDEEDEAFTNAVRERYKSAR